MTPAISTEPRVQANSERDYFAFPMTPQQALEEFALREQLDDVRDEEKKLRAAASAALKAANAKKKQIAHIERRQRWYSQRRSPGIWGVDQLTPAEQAAWKTHQASGEKSPPNFEMRGAMAFEFCDECAAKVSPDLPRRPIRGYSLFAECFACKKSWSLKWAIVVTPEMVIERQAQLDAESGKQSDLTKHVLAYQIGKVTHRSIR